MERQLGFVRTQPGEKISFCKVVVRGKGAPPTIPATPCKLIKFLKEHFRTKLNKIVAFEDIYGSDQVWMLLRTCWCSVSSRAKVRLQGENTGLGHCSTSGESCLTGRGWTAPAAQSPGHREKICGTIISTDAHPNRAFCLRRTAGIKGIGFAATGRQGRNKPWQASRYTGQVFWILCGLRCFSWFWPQEER